MLTTLLRSPAWRRWTFASLLARLPVTMALLGVMVAVEEVTGSIGTGSQVVGVMTIVAGLLGPAMGRRLDAIEVRRALQLRCLAMSATFAGLALLVRSGAPLPGFYLLAGLAGLSLAGMWAGFRGLLVVVLPPEQRRHAHFVESLMIEVSYGVGPLLVGYLVAAFGGAGALVVMAGLAAGAAISLFGVPRHRAERAERAVGVWRRPDLAVVYTFVFLLGITFGMFESNVAIRMDGYGLLASDAGRFIALLALSSCIGGLFVSIRPLHLSDPMRTASSMLVVFGLCAIPSALAPSVGWYGASLLVASLLLVPLNGIGGAEVESRTTDGRRVEAFAFLMAAMQLGSGLGAVLNGFIANALGARKPAWVVVAMLVTMGIALRMLSRRAGAPREGEEPLAPVVPSGRPGAVGAASSVVEGHSGEVPAATATGSADALPLGPDHSADPTALD